MDISGRDITFNTDMTPDEALAVVGKMIKTQWQSMICESAEDDECPEDTFFYENERARRMWQVDVPPESSNAHMIYALFRWGYVTLMCDRGTGSETVALNVAKWFGYKSEDKEDTNYCS